jgi:hypothetical protein
MSAPHCVRETVVGQATVITLRVAEPYLTQPFETSVTINSGVTPAASARLRRKGCCLNSLRHNEKQCFPSHFGLFGIQTVYTLQGGWCAGVGQYCSPILLCLL